MKIADVKDIEDCFDGSYIKEILLDKEITKDFIFYLGNRGELEYFPDFARPFFKITAENEYVIKGVEGNKTARLTLYKKSREEMLSFLYEYIRKY